MLDVIARELGIDPLDVRRRNYVDRDEPPLAMLTGQPFVGVTTQECVEQAAAVVDWDGFRRRQARGAGRRSLPRARHGVVPRGGARTQGPGPGRHGRGILGDEVDPRLGRRRRHDRRSSPASSRTARATRRRSPRSRPTSSACGSRTSTWSSATPTSRRWRWSAPAAAGRRRWPTASVLHGSRRAEGARSCRSPPTCSRPTPPTSRSATASISVRGTPSRRSSRWPSWPGSSREEPDRLPDGRRRRARR